MSGKLSKYAWSPKKPKSDRARKAQNKKGAKGRRFGPGSSPYRMA